MVSTWVDDIPSLTNPTLVITYLHSLNVCFYLFYQTVLVQADTHIQRVLLARYFKALHRNVADVQEQRQNKHSADQFFRFR